MINSWTGTPGSGIVQNKPLTREAWDSLIAQRVRKMLCSHFSSEEVAELSDADVLWFSV